MFTKPVDSGESPRYDSAGEGLLGSREPKEIVEIFGFDFHIVITIAVRVIFDGSD